MTTFIHDVLQDLKTNNVVFSNLTFILPSKRAGLFLKKELSILLDQPIFSPTIISIEDFVEEISELKSTSNVELLFEFYTTYQKITAKNNQESFENFSNWAQTLIQDFNEIDRYLIPQNQIFDYLSAIQELNHWSLENNQTHFIKKYLIFWKHIKTYYTAFSENLIQKGIGYQGLIYREAVENIQNYIASNHITQHIFLGFNALNTAEETIIQELLENNLATIYWDIDTSFFENQNHDAGLFVRNYKKWPFFKNKPFNWITSNYKDSKNITIVGVSQNVGQAKCIGQILSQLQNKQLKNTAVVLGEESLLLPVLNSIPENINTINITMGLPLKSIPLATLFEHLFYIHKKNSDNFYYKDVLKLISHPFICPLFELDYQYIICTIESNNLTYLNINKLESLTPNHQKLIRLLLEGWNNKGDHAINQCQKIILKIKSHLEHDKQANLLSLEHLYQFHKIFNELLSLNVTHGHLKDIGSIYNIYKELLNSETLDFQGEPLQGLQIMGMLESRVLDFETVIISSVNEGILPSGKSQNSFIPFDVKLENNLPTYKEKDAVYTYHFYRLLQRAKNIYILYNTEIDVLTGGEKSRFITQMELEKIHKINHVLVAPEVPFLSKNLTQIKKDSDVINQIKNYAKAGFSPSALTSYIRNPLDFYYQKVLKIKEHDDIEETVAANTLGTVIHNVLETFYKPFVGKSLTTEVLKDMKSKITINVSKQFQELYKEGNITQGKNLIIYEISKRYISNFLDLEIEDINAGNTIEIISIESKLDANITIPELDFPVSITGKVDRVDKRNGIIRIIDYKSGKVDQNKVQLTNWEDITTDYDKYSKSFQVLAYAYLMHKNTPFEEAFEAGIISFKNLGAGFLKFAQKDLGSSNKTQLITEDILNNFELELINLIMEICNPELDFIEKEIVFNS